MSIAAFLGLIISRRRLVLWVTGFFAVAVAAFVFLSRREYSVTATLLPQANDAQSGMLSQLASTLGAVTGAGSGQGPEFYADLLQSRELAGAVVDSSTHWAGQTLYDVLRARGGDPAVRRERAIDRLTDRLKLKTDDASGTLTFTLRLPDPRAAFLSAQMSLRLVNEFDETRRRSSAAQQRDFTRQRLDAAATRLRAAEDSAAGFLTKNRDFQNSPALTFQYGRLTRAVTLATTVYTGLAQMSDQAAIEAVRTTPVVTVVTRPVLPVRPDRLHLLLKVLVAIIIGGCIGSLLAVVDYRGSGARPDGAELEALALTTLAAVVALVRSAPARVFSRPFGRPR